MFYRVVFLCRYFVCFDIFFWVIVVFFYLWYIGLFCFILFKVLRLNCFIRESKKRGGKIKGRERENGRERVKIFFEVLFIFEVIYL